MTKLATYRRPDGAVRIGIVDAAGARVFDLSAAAERAGAAAAPFGSMLDLMDAGEAGLDVARHLLDRRAGEDGLWVELGAVDLLAPVPRPRQMRDGMSFPLHIRQSPRGMRKLAADAPIPRLWPGSRPNRWRPCLTSTGNCPSTTSPTA